MNNSKERENFRYYDEHSPERKIELAEGRVLVGNSLEGSRLLLDHILRGWGVDAAAALGGLDLWLGSLRELYGSIKDIDAEPPPMAWRAPDVTSGGEGPDADHHRVREHLGMSFFTVAESLGGQALGRVVMKLGDNAFTPDTMFYKSDGLNAVSEYYLQGPAELAIEVVRPAHRDYDYRVKRQYYERGGVPEYLIVDPERRHFEFLRLVNGRYVTQQPDGDGSYRPVSIPGLAIQPEYFWPKGSYRGVRLDDPNPFIVEKSQGGRRTKPRADAEFVGVDLPFEPHLDLQPVPVLFQEYLAWTPEAKFEFWDGRIQISGEEGVRNITGLLLATLGLVEACRFARPEQWLAALRRRQAMERREQDIRSEWRQRARDAAEFLRSKYQPKRIALTGALLSPERLTFWSRLTLAVWGVPFEQMQQLYQDLSAREIDLLEAEYGRFQERVDRGDCQVEDL